MFDIHHHRGYQPLANWVDAGNGWVPCGKSVIGGHDLNGEVLYIGRTRIGGDIIPGKIVPSHNVCYAAYAGNEHGERFYQALTAPANAEFVWVRSEHGQVPTGAIQGGITSSGEKLYIGRVVGVHQGATCIGKVQPSHRTCYVSFAGKEHGHTHYEVLCVKDVPMQFN